MKSEGEKRSSWKDDNHGHYPIFLNIKFIKLENLQMHEIIRQEYIKIIRQVHISSNSLSNHLMDYQTNIDRFFRLIIFDYIDL